MSPMEFQNTSNGYTVIHGDSRRYPLFATLPEFYFEKLQKYQKVQTNFLQSRVLIIWTKDATCITNGSEINSAHVCSAHHSNLTMGPMATVMSDLFYLE